ncbi:mechanosensitive ion channel [Aquimarina sp. U1-2]|uniref:mechanosensitive ion channel domain-containing protein n=1 Tax=Aquimarina sp. U1-2 TaxID=2823141 RepID=UPI001AECEB45|nr:mechanosensitive ion channel domain-containing protein [Aquimarina sp. U1-2]MBP2831622.1 mechanosensitive ion channel [Aquimarina sp. U1-2]
MKPYYINIIESSIIIAIYIVLRIAFFNIISRTLKKRLIQQSRGFLIKKVVHIVLLFICVIFIFLIWGVNQSDLAVFVGSVLTVVGVAFFAQWSILSNITSSIIIFFKHPVKLNDSISLLEGKDYVIEGRVVTIGLFFITLQTAEEEEITIPNNIFIQKSIRKRNDSSTVSTT